MSFTWRPGPFANIHGPPDTNELKSFNPAKIVGRRVVEGVNQAVSSELNSRISQHDEAPRGAERQGNMGFGAIGKRRNVTFEGLALV